ncbi:IS110 family transposase [Micromonospora inyonensis]|uniref:Transposase n=1 Tax=Micromonospora inyonensis TaxID=47866 RepID=A0A1C6S655_9ACTN|nr:IS110 family transposase [Micromonospora inyonensis]SCL24756.1 Transposase [Micromonospora inyonensis]
MSREPEEIHDPDHEIRLERVAAIDVAKASGKVCTRLPHPTQPHRRVTLVWDVVSTTNELCALAQRLVTDQIERVVLESTGDYWRPFYYILEAHGVTVWLVNANDVKQVPGRPKTDKLDAVWLAKLNEHGMLRPSFVPPKAIRDIRDYTRLRHDLVADRTRYKLRLDKLLEDALIKLSTVATNFLGLSGRAMIDALVAGERDPHRLAELALGKLRVKRPALVEALTGRFDDHHATIAAVLLQQIDALDAEIDKLTVKIDQLIVALPAAGTDEGRRAAAAMMPSVLERLDEIPGVGSRVAQIIIAETGGNMAQFPTAGHLVSWTKLSPRTMQSGPKTRRGPTGHGSPYLKSVLGDAAAAAARTNTFLGERYRRLVKRRGKARALVAIARSILTIVWHILADPTARFIDLGPDHYATHINKHRKTRSLIRQLEALGHIVQLHPA